MALTDINTQFPRLKLKSLLEKRQLINHISYGTTFSAADIMGMIYALRDVLLDNLKNATPVRLEGIGIFSPTLKLDGTIKIRFRPDKEFLRDLNTEKDNLRDRITHKKNVGKTLDDLQELVSSDGK